MTNPALGFDPQALMANLIRRGMVWFKEPPAPAVDDETEKRRAYMREAQKKHRAKMRLIKSSLAHSN